MKQVAAVLLSTTLCACSVMTPPENELYNKSTDKGTENKWVGHTVDELVVTVGEPSNVYMLEGGVRVFEYLQLNKTTASTHHSIFAEEETVWRQRTKRKNLVSDQYQNCKVIIILFNVSASDIIESWSSTGRECN